MDRFKFRAWDKEKDIFGYDIENCYDDWDCQNFYDYIVKNRYIVEQCTGFKDKNGKLIYEGDELKDWKNKPFVIAFDEDYAQFVAKDENGWVSPIERDVLEDCEIIGNIHENADLLGEE